MLDKSGEHTNIAVNQLLAKQRRNRLPVLIGVVAVACFLTYMVVAFGPKRSKELTVDGPVAPGQAGHQMTPSSHPARSAAHGAAGAATCDVRIAISGPKGQLLLDGKPVELPATGKISIDPGNHVLSFKRGGKTQTQQLEVAAGEHPVVSFGGKMH